MLKNINGYESAPDIARKTASPYMASTTLSNQTIEDIIFCFTINLTIRDAAKKADQSPKAINYYYGLLLDRLIQVEYYYSWGEFFFIESYNQDVFNSQKEYCDFHIRKHRGLRPIKHHKLQKKYFSQFFYILLYRDAIGYKEGTEKIVDMMYKDTLDIIKITGPLNIDPTEDSLKLAGIHLTKAIERRLPRALTKGFRSFCNNNEQLAYTDLFQWHLYLMTLNGKGPLTDRMKLLFGIN